jgi:hypothetical protein
MPSNTTTAPYPGPVEPGPGESGDVEPPGPGEPYCEGCKGPHRPLRLVIIP